MLILDTHALYWWVNRPPGKLGQRQVDAIETAESLAVSAMTCWEMAWLVEHGRIVLHLSAADWFDPVEKSGVAMPSTACKPWPSSRAIIFERKWVAAVVLCKHVRSRAIYLVAIANGGVGDFEARDNRLSVVS